MDDQQLNSSSNAMRFRRGESLSEGLGRVVTEQCDIALGLATAAQQDEAAAVHDTRKAIKRLRAVLRLVRDSIPNEAYRTDNDVLRLIASELSWIRDAWVMASTLDGLDITDVEAAFTVSTLHERLLARYEIERDAMLGNAAHVASIVEQIERVKKRSRVWALVADDPERPLPHCFESIASGLERVYKRSRKAMHNAAAGPTDTLLHNWRKRAKYLRHQVEVLNVLDPIALGEQESALELLTDQLGTDHDLAVLGRRLDKDVALVAAVDPEPVRDAIAVVRHQLQTDAFGLGASLFEASPREYVAYVGSLWVEGETF